MKSVMVFEKNLRIVINYLYDTEKKHYEESGKPKKHIFVCLNRLVEQIRKSKKCYKLGKKGARKL